MKATVFFMMVGCAATPTTPHHASVPQTDTRLENTDPLVRECLSDHAYEVIQGDNHICPTCQARGIPTMDFSESIFTLGVVSGNEDAATRSAVSFCWSIAEDYKDGIVTFKDMFASAYDAHQEAIRKGKLSLLKDNPPYMDSNSKLYLFNVGSLCSDEKTFSGFDAKQRAWEKYENLLKDVEIKVPGSHAKFPQKGNDCMVAIFGSKM